jgi:uncharacterized membrane protein YeiB
MTPPMTPPLSAVPPAPRSAPAVPRDAAMDVARAIAILGMFVIHAVLVLSGTMPTEGVSGFLLWWCDGRAAATFVTLAGFGVARLASRLDAANGARVLQRRALVLWAMGVLNLIVWPGDILRVYGVALLLAPWLLRWSVRGRLAGAVALGALFPLLMTVLDWTHHWQLETLTYVGVWSPSGFARNLLYDGFRPVVPWLGFFIVGTVLAEQELRAPRLWQRLLAFGAVATTVAVALSRWLDRALAVKMPALDALTREGLVGTTSLPPLPLFLLSAMGTTALLLGTVLAIVPRLSPSAIAPLVATGRRALTWYVWHVVVLVALYTLGPRQALPPMEAIAAGVVMFAVAVAWSHRHRDRPGMCERFMRWAAGGTTGRRESAVGPVTSG